MKRKTLEEFIKEANRVHNYRYSYSEVKEYVSAHNKVPITCGIHGTFMQKPSGHLHRKEGCPSCAIEGRTRTLKQFIASAIKIHGNSYGYPNIEKYTHLPTKIKIDIQCNTCRHVFQQSPSNHLYFHNNCPKCSRKEYGKKGFVEAVRKLYGDKFDYSLANYVNQRTNIDIVCSKHGIFNQRPASHLRGGCPKCSFLNLNGLYSDHYFDKYPHKKNVDALLYIVSVDNEFIKVGITTSNIKKRMNGSRMNSKKYKVIKKYKLSLYDAFCVEKKLLSSFIKHKYRPDTFKGGQTECFRINVANNVVEFIEKLIEVRI